MDPVSGWAIAWPVNALVVTALHPLLREIGISHALAKKICKLIALSTLTLPFFIDRNEVFAIGVISLCCAFYCHRAIEVVVEPDLLKLPYFYRVTHVGLSFHDVRTRKVLKDEKKIYTFNKIIELVKHSAAIVLSTLILQSLPRISIFFGRILTMYVASVAGGVHLWKTLSVLEIIIDLWSIPSSDRYPRIMNSPEKSLSVQEFWSRWDTVVQQILKKYVFTPMYHDAGISKEISALLTFFASGLLHIYPLYVAGLSNLRALEMFSFFLVQVVLIKLEIYLEINKLSPAKRRIWMFSAILLPSPLFMKPVLHLLELDSF